MENVVLESYENNQQGFVIRDGENKIAEMVMKISGNDMTVYHTEVSPRAAGKGLAKKLFDTMVAYARERHLNVIPLCVFVLAQLKRHPENYTDIWQNQG